MIIYRHFLTYYPTPYSIPSGYTNPDIEIDSKNIDYLSKMAGDQRRKLVRKSEPTRWI